MDLDEAEWYHRNLDLGKDWKVDGVRYQVSPLKVRVLVSFVGENRCPICGGRCTRFDTRTREWRDLDYGRAKCNIVATIPRMNCGSCGIREVKVSWAGIASNLTRGLERSILDMARLSQVNTAVKHYRVDGKTGWNIVRTYTNLVIQGLDLSDTTVVLIDETSSSKGHRYISNVIDHHTGCIIHCTEGNDSSVLWSFRYWLIHHNCDPENIRVICCDMSRSYIKGVEEAFPNASICFDRFHVIKHANDMVDNVRRKVGLKSRHGKGLRFGFTMNREDLERTSERYRSKVEETLRTYEDLGRAYAVKEALRDLYMLDQPQHASYFLRSLIIYCKNSGAEDIISLGNMLETHSEGILFWHSFKVTNGAAEGRNSVIQAMKASSRGFANVDNMISMVYLKSTLDHPSLSSNPLLRGI